MVKGGVSLIVKPQMAQIFADESLSFLLGVEPIQFIFFTCGYLRHLRFISPRHHLLQTNPGKLRSGVAFRGRVWQVSPSEWRATRTNLRVLSGSLTFQSRAEGA